MQVVYRKQAIDFQRRRLAGEVSVVPRRHIMGIAALVLATMVMAAMLAWGWSVDVMRDAACVARGPMLVIDGSSLPRGARLIDVEQGMPVPQPVDARHVAVERDIKAEPGCLARIHLSVHPVREAFVRAFPR